MLRGDWLDFEGALADGVQELSDSNRGYGEEAHPWV